MAGRTVWRMDSSAFSKGWIERALVIESQRSSLFSFGAVWMRVPRKFVRSGGMWYGAIGGGVPYQWDDAKFRSAVGQSVLFVVLIWSSVAFACVSCRMKYYKNAATEWNGGGVRTQLDLCLLKYSTSLHAAPEDGRNEVNHKINPCHKKQNAEQPRKKFKRNRLLFSFVLADGYALAGRLIFSVVSLLRSSVHLITPFASFFPSLML